MIASSTRDRIPTSVLSTMLIGLPLIILPESTHPGYFPKLLFFQTGIAVLAAFAALQAKTPVITPLLLPAVVLLLSTTLSVSQSVNPVASVVVLGHRAGLLAVFVLAATLVTRRDVTRLTTAVCVGSAATAILGIAQYAGWFGLSIPSSGMPSATFGYRNFAAAYTIAAIPFLAAEVLRRNETQRFIWTGLLFLNVAFLLCTRTRAAWGACALSAVFGLVVYVWKRRQPGRFRPQRPRQALLLISGTAAAALLFSIVVPPDMQRRGYDRSNPEKATLQGSIAATFESGADKDRFAMWGNTFEMIADSPVLGVGPGNWQFVYPDFDRGDVSWKGATPMRPHNDYLWITAETGLVGLAAAVWLVVLGAAAAFRALKSATDQDSFAPVLASVVALVAVAAHGVFSFPLERIPVTFLGAIALSIVVIHDPRTRPRRPSMPMTVVAWVLVVASLAAAAISWRAVTFDRLSFRQLVAVEREDWPAVARHGTEALKLGVFDPQILLLRGLSYHMTGAYDLAIDDQTACLSYHPFLVNAINNLGMSLNAAGRFDEAIDALDRIETLNPDHIEGHLNLARSYAGKSQGKDAILELREAHRKAPKRTDILSELTRQYEKSGDLVRAAEMVERAIALRPQNHDLHYRLGVIRQKQGDLKAAASRFRRVLRLNREHIPVLYNLGELYLALGDTVKAVQAYEAFVSRWTGPPRAVDPVRRKLETLR